MLPPLLLHSIPTRRDSGPRRRRAFALASLVLTTAGAAGAAEFVAPYVASPQEDVELMLELADVGPGDYVVDLGSGDGRIVITAGLRGAMGHGVELDRELVFLARENARAAEVADRASFHQGDIFQADLQHATVVTLYLMQDVNLRLRPKLLAELAPGTRVLSNSFHMGEWQPDRHVYGRASGGIRLWVVPAAVAGRWHVTVGEERFTLDLEQQFQRLQARLAQGNDLLHVLETTLRGDRVAVLAGDGHRRLAFSGRVENDRMVGLAQIHRVNDTRVMTWTGRRDGS